MFNSHFPLSRQDSKRSPFDYSNYTPIVKCQQYITLLESIDKMVPFFTASRLPVYIPPLNAARGLSGFGLTTVATTLYSILE